MAHMNSEIKYKFILDAMETDDLKPLEVNKAQKILAFSNNNGQIKHKN